MAKPFGDLALLGITEKARNFTELKFLLLKDYLLIKKLL
jgi:hypothetical protein